MFIHLSRYLVPPWWCYPGCYFCLPVRLLGEDFFFEARLHKLKKWKSWPLNLCLIHRKMSLQRQGIYQVTVTFYQVRIQRDWATRRWQGCTKPACDWCDKICADSPDHGSEGRNLEYRNVLVNSKRFPTNLKRAITRPFLPLLLYTLPSITIAVSFLSSMESMVSSSHPTQRAFNPYTENGGTILAIAGADFSVIAGDTRQSEGYSIQTRYAPKVFRLYVQLFSFVFFLFFHCWAEQTRLYWL